VAATAGFGASPSSQALRRRSFDQTDSGPLRLGGRNWFSCPNFGPFLVRSQGVRSARFSPDFTIVCRLITQLGREACSTPRRVGVRPEGARADFAVQTMYQEFALIPVC
jgi:hypothetical protein